MHIMRAREWHACYSVAHAKLRESIKYKLELGRQQQTNMCLTSHNTKQSKEDGKGRPRFAVTCSFLSVQARIEQEHSEFNQEGFERGVLQRHQESTICCSMLRGLMHLCQPCQGLRKLVAFEYRKHVLMDSSPAACYGGGTCNSLYCAASSSCRAFMLASWPRLTLSTLLMAAFCCCTFCASIF